MWGAIRLANDVRSYEREKEDQKINSIVLLMAEKHLSEREAEQEVTAQISGYLAHMDELGTKLPPYLSAWALSVRRLGRFATGWYLTREFHNFSKEALQNLSIPQ